MRLIERMQAEVDAQVESILSEAKKQAAEIEESAQREIQRLGDAARSATNKRVALEKARRSAKILQQVKKEESELKRDLVEQAFDKARKQLEELGDAEYGKLFDHLAREALSDLAHKVTISVREGDAKRAKDAVKKAGAKADVEADLDGQGGGLTARSDDGAVFIDNTLFTRLERSRIDGVMVAGNILFGSAEAGAAEESSDDQASEE